MEETLMAHSLFALLNKLETYALHDVHSRVKLTTHDTGSFTIRIICEITRNTVISYDALNQVANIVFQLAQLPNAADESVEIHNPNVIKHIYQLKDSLQKELKKKDFITTDGFYKMMEVKLNNRL